MTPARWRWWLPALGWFGCTPAETTLFEDNPALTPKGTECALDPDCGEPVWRPEWFSMTATFAIDPTGQALQAYEEGGQTVLPHVVFTLTHDAVPTPCVVTLTLDDPSSVAVEEWSWVDPSASEQAMLHTGFDVPTSPRATSEGCGWVDPVGFGDPAQNVASITWGFGVGTLRDDVARLLRDGDAGAPLFEAEHARGNVVGGSWSSNVWSPAIWGSHAAVVSRLSGDAEHVVDADGWPVELVSAEEVLSGPPLPARVHVQTVTLFTADYLSR